MSFGLNNKTGKIVLTTQAVLYHRHVVHKQNEVLALKSLFPDFVLSFCI